MGPGRAGDRLTEAAVFNAFRLGVRLGRVTLGLTQAELASLQCLSAGSPVGTKAPCHARPHAGVFNAFRLGVRLGRSGGNDSRPVCFASSMPFGWESGWDSTTPAARPNTESKVFNAFRLGVRLGRRQVDRGGSPRPGLQCLSAGSPVGTARKVEKDVVPAAVFNAFRLGVRLGQCSHGDKQYVTEVFNAFRLGVRLGPHFSEG